MRNKLEAKETVDARKVSMGRKEALGLASGIEEIYVSKGSKIVHLDIKGEKPSPDTIVNLLLGPTGNLRAPTVRKGRILLVGFDEAAYKKVLT